MTSLVTSIVHSAAASNAAPKRAEEEEAAEEAKLPPSADARAAIEARRKLRAAELRAIEAQAAADVAQQQALGAQKELEALLLTSVPPTASGGGESERVLGGHATPDYGYLSDDQQDDEQYGEGCDELRQASACNENKQAEEAEEATGGVELAIVGRAVPIHRVDLSPLAFEALVETVQEEEEAAAEEEGAPEAAEHVKLTKLHVSKSIHKELMSSEAFSSLIVNDSVAVGEEGGGERVNIPSSVETLVRGFAAELLQAHGVELCAAELDMLRAEAMKWEVASPIRENVEEDQGQPELALPDDEEEQALPTSAAVGTLAATTQTSMDFHSDWVEEMVEAMSREELQEQATMTSTTEEDDDDEWDYVSEADEGVGSDMPILLA